MKTARSRLRNLMSSISSSHHSCILILLSFTILVLFIAASPVVAVQQEQIDHSISTASSSLIASSSNSLNSLNSISSIVQDKAAQQIRNITNTYKGTWYRTDGTLYNSLTDNGVFSFTIKADEVIARRYHFIEGRAGVRDGIYLHHKLYQFTVRGIYDLDAAKLYFYLLPSAYVLHTLTNTYNAPSCEHIRHLRK